jgi:hypothetical protein
MTQPERSRHENRPTPSPVPERSQGEPGEASDTDTGEANPAGREGMSGTPPEHAEGMAALVNNVGDEAPTG